MLFAALPTVVFGVFTIVFTLQQNASARATREQDQRQEDENNRRTIFKEYIDDITELLLERTNQANFSKILSHIRVQTLTVLQNLDARQKRNVIVFLYENQLLRSDISPQVDLRGADFNGIRFWSSSTVACQMPFLYLPGIYAENIVFDRCSLPGAVFDRASMTSAKFSSCSMWNVQFTHSNLTGAQFYGNHMFDANFSGAYLVQSSIKNGSFRSVDLTSTDLYQSDIDNQLLYPMYSLGLAPHTFRNTRFPNGSFVHLDKENLFVVDKSVDDCNASIRLASNNHLINRREIFAIKELSTNNSCFLLRRGNQDYFITIDINQFSLLIDLEQAAFDLSWYNRFNYSNNDEFFVTMIFIEGEQLINEKEFLTVSNKANSEFQFGYLRNDIPAKSRFLVLKFSCDLHDDSDQYCVFDQVKLFVIERRSLNTNGNNPMIRQRT